MNGEMFQLCMLVNAARNAIIKKKDFTYLCDEYVSSVKFLTPLEVKDRFIY